MNHLVLSGTATVVPSGTPSSCYQGPDSQLSHWRSIPCRLRNFPNLESFGFLLTDCASRRAVDSALAAKPHASVWRSLGQSRRQQAVVACTESGFPQSLSTNSGGRRD